MGRTWDDTADKQMLLSIIHTSAPKVEWDQVRAAMGEDYTLESLKQRYKKLRNLKPKESSDSPAPSDAAATKAPAAKKGMAKKLTAADKKRKAAAAAAEVDEDDEEEYREQTAKSKKTKKVKKEPTEEDEDGELQ